MFYKLVTNGKGLEFKSLIRVVDTKSTDGWVADKNLPRSRNEELLFFEGITYIKHLRVETAGFLAKTMVCEMVSTNGLYVTLGHCLNQHIFLKEVGIGNVPVLFLFNEKVSKEDNKPILKSSIYGTFNFVSHKVEEHNTEDFTTRIFIPTESEQTDLDENFDCRLNQVRTEFKERVQSPYLIELKNIYKDVKQATIAEIEKLG